MSIYVSNERSNQFSLAVWMIGIGVLLMTNYWWPGVMFVAGAASVVAGLAQGRRWYALAGGFWSFAVGVWAIYKFHPGVISITIGIFVLFAAIFKPPFLESKPVVDNTLE